MQKIVNRYRKNLSKKLDDALWAYRTAYKNPMGMSPYKMVSNLPVRRGYLILAHLMNGEPKLMKMPSCLKKKWKAGMTKGYKSVSLT